jgi:ABC-type amino acid transport substrate-binding protein
MDNKRILIAETSVEFSESLREILSPAYAVQICNSGLSVMSLLEEFDPDVLVMDLALPGIDGISLLKQISVLPTRPCILLTTCFMSRYVETAISGLGVDLVILKPCMVEILAERIEDLTQAQEPQVVMPLRSRPTVSAMLMDLNSNKIISIGVDKAIGNYIVARNENLMSVILDTWKDNFSMMTMDSNQEVYDILNNAIKEMKADGTLDSLIENELKAYINSDPEPKDLPHFDGAKTIKIGVTGDLPPMDFVAANGKAAGFNIALLTEIANRSQINIKLVQIETGARAMALASGKVDAVFWTKGLACADCNEPFTEDIPGTIITESYFSDSPAYIILKAE